jgi:single-strand selective monofunctional uracil DNA glycosylase
VRNNRAEELVAAAFKLSSAVKQLKFPSNVAFVYNPLDYAWPAHETYLRKFGNARKRVVFLGMNPGPFGMAQTGIPFGQIAAVRDWLDIHAPVGKPPREHPKRPVLGFDCQRSEVSGARLWSLFATRFGTAREFFSGHFVSNYCPLAFLSESGANLTPDKFSGGLTTKLFTACDEHLRHVVQILEPEWVIGVGGFARDRAEAALSGNSVKVGQMLHPSPASPAANRDWAGQATLQLEALGIW